MTGDLWRGSAQKAQRAAERVARKREGKDKP
jgi:hypothetical protein